MSALIPSSKATPRSSMSPAPHCNVSLPKCLTAPLCARADSCALAQELMDITSNVRAAFLASSGESITERTWLGPWRAIEAPSLECQHGCLLLNRGSQLLKIGGKITQRLIALAAA